MEEDAAEVIADPDDAPRLNRAGAHATEIAASPILQCNLPACAVHDHRPSLSFTQKSNRFLPPCRLQNPVLTTQTRALTPRQKTSTQPPPTPPTRADAGLKALLPSQMEAI